MRDKEVPTIANSKTGKRRKLRNSEYYDLQMVFDKLYADSKDGKIFRNLMEIISSNENIGLAYRNIKVNKGSKTPGVDGKTIDDMKSWNSEKLISAIKECYIVRYADDFKIFCRKRSDAVKLFEATKLWLKERLGLDISPEKSKIVNLKRNYSEYLGFKLKAKAKGKKNGKAKYVVTSHISDKSSRKILDRANVLIRDIFHHTDKETAYRCIGQYNAFVLGVHEYYSIATEVSKDFHKISFHVNRTLKDKLRTRLKRPVMTRLKGKAIIERYGKSRELRSVFDLAVAPIAYVQHRNPMWKRTSINKYTPEGRKQIHTNLQGVNTGVLLALMRNPTPHRSIEYNDNRISLYSGQGGKCAVTGRKLSFEEIHCHHKVPRYLGGDDSYNNLRIVHENVHKLIHAQNGALIQRLLEQLQLTAHQIERVNALRKLCQLSPITVI